MLVMTVPVGAAVQIGEVAVVRVEHKNGQYVRLALATHLAVEYIASGIIPRRFTTGISGERRRVGNDDAPMAAALTA